MANRHWNLLACTIVVACSIAALWPAFQSAAMPMDEGMVLVYPEMLLKGHLPYRDFESITGPGNMGILAAAYSLFGTNIFVERAIGLGYRLLILISIFAIVQRWGLLISTACVFILGVLLAVTDLWANTWFAGVAFAVCALWLMVKINSARRCLAAGISAGLALLCRCDLGPALILSTLPLFLLMKSRNRKIFLAALAVALLPLLWLTVAAGPAMLLRSLFLYPVFGLNPGRHLPLAPAPADLQRVFALHLSASVVNVAAGFIALRLDPRSPCARCLLGTTILGFAFIHYALQRFDSGHVINAALVALSLAPLSIFILFSRVTKKFPAWLRSAVAIVIAITATHLLLSPFTRYFYRGLRVTLGMSPARQASKTGDVLEAGDKGFFISHNGRSFPFGFRYAADDADNVLTELERVSLPGQRLFVGPGDLRLTNYCDTYIYYMEPQLRPATYFLEMNPGSANAPNSRLADDIASADWVVLNRRWDFLNESNRSIHVGPAEPNHVVREQFDFWVECGSYLLFRNKKLSNAIVPPPPRP